MNNSSISPIVYDYSAVIKPETASPLVRQFGLSRADLDWAAPRLIDARREVLEDLALFQKGGPVPAEKAPLDAAFMDLPERFLGRDRAVLDDIRATADRLAGEVDRVVVLGIGGSYMGARALFEACCHPCHNELRARPARAGRGSISKATTSITTPWPDCSTCWPATTAGRSWSSARAAARWRRPWVSASFSMP